MVEVLKTKLKRDWHTGFMRVVAIFFLLYTFADITLPQYFCGSDAELVFNHNSVNVAHKEAANIDTETTISNNQQNQHEQEEKPHTEDCFCCCAHVLPSLSFISPHVDYDKYPLPIIQSDSTPNPSIPLPYHPPRIA
jgi:hypothetical protein